jgi:hypothetical protein
MGKGKHGGQQDDKASEVGEELQSLGHNPEGLTEALRRGGAEEQEIEKSRYVRKDGGDKTFEARMRRRDARRGHLAPWK